MGEIELLELAERVEKLSGPCEAVDLEIARIQRVVCLRRNAEDTANEEFTHWRYTASLDAAMTLVPEGEGHQPQLIYSGVNPNNPSRQRCRYEIWQKGSTKPTRSNAATPALALCAAALRARASITRTTGDGEASYG